MRDVIFIANDEQYTPPPIVIRTSGFAGVDLTYLIERIKRGYAPDSQELIATLEDIHKNMMEGRI